MQDLFIPGLSVILGTLIAIQIARMERQSAFRLAALDKRLETHQRAYRLWSKLLWSLHNREELRKRTRECQEWWIDNCLYLDPLICKEFKSCIGIASSYNDFKPDRGTTKANFKRINSVFEYIVRGVELPTIGEQERPEIPSRKDE